MPQAQRTVVTEDGAQHPGEVVGLAELAAQCPGHEFRADAVGLQHLPAVRQEVPAFVRVDERLVTHRIREVVRVAEERFQGVRGVQVGERTATFGRAAGTGFR
ncbi:hypothetical protein GCM10020000_12700 [Streptomyces olivoverticillatus]